jgi:hypothetical protein
MQDCPVRPEIKGTKPREVLEGLKNIAIADDICRGYYDDLRDAVRQRQK